MKFKAGDRVWNTKYTFRDPKPGVVLKVSAKQVVIQEDADGNWEGSKWTITGSDIQKLFHTESEAFESLAQREDSAAASAERSAKSHRESAVEYRRKARESKTN